MPSNTLPKTGKEIALYRTNTANGSLSSTTRTAPSVFQVGIKQTTVNSATTNLVEYVPVLDGTMIFDCSSAFTGSSGGDNSTNNTTVFKQTGTTTDNTAQNLIANGTNVNKIWTKEPTTANWVGTSFAGFWLYIKDSATLAKIVSVTLRAGADSSNYWSKQWLNAGLVVGWNWLTTGVLNTNTPTGTVTGTLDYSAIVIVTNNAADTFVAGDVVADAIRQWVVSDLTSSFEASYPTLNYTNLEAVYRTRINSAQANGFDINGIILLNGDTTRIPMNVTESNPESKSNTDEFIYVYRNRIL